MGCRWSGYKLIALLKFCNLMCDGCSIFLQSMVLSAVFCLSHGDFLSMLCSSDLSSREDDANVDYDLFKSAGWVLSIFSSSGQSVTSQFKLSLQNNLTMSSYAHQRTSLFIKMIANLHCFVPNVCEGDFFFPSLSSSFSCIISSVYLRLLLSVFAVNISAEQDRNRFIQNVMSGLRKDPSSILIKMLPGSSYTPVAQRGTGVCRNLGMYLYPEIHILFFIYTCFGDFVLMDICICRFSVAPCRILNP